MLEWSKEFRSVLLVVKQKRKMGELFNIHCSVIESKPLDQERSYFSLICHLGLYIQDIKQCTGQYQWQFRKNANIFYTPVLLLYCSIKKKKKKPKAYC